MMTITIGQFSVFIIGATQDIENADDGGEEWRLGGGQVRGGGHRWQKVVLGTERVRDILITLFRSSGLFVLSHFPHHLRTIIQAWLLTSITIILTIFLQTPKSASSSSHDQNHHPRHQHYPKRVAFVLKSFHVDVVFINQKKIILEKILLAFSFSSCSFCFRIVLNEECLS